MRITGMTTGLSLVLALASTAAAQPKPAAPPPQPAAQPAAAQPPRTASPQELVSQGEAVVRRGTTVGQTVRNMLEEARKEADIIKVTCLDDKLTQINVNMRTAEGRLDALKKAVDPDQRMHEYTVLTVLAQKLQVLDQEAHQCVGQAMYETGQTKVVTQIDTKMMPFEENASSFPVITPGSAIITLPPMASGPK